MVLSFLFLFVCRRRTRRTEGWSLGVGEENWLELGKGVDNGSTALGRGAVLDQGQVAYKGAKVIYKSQKSSLRPRMQGSGRHVLDSAIRANVAKYWWNSWGETCLVVINGRLLNLGRCGLLDCKFLQLWSWNDNYWCWSASIQHSLCVVRISLCQN